MPRKRNKKVYWGAMVLDTFKKLQDPDLKGSDFKVLFHLWENMDNEKNEVFIRQVSIAEKLKMNKSNVSKSIKLLSSKQFVVKTANGFMMNPHLFYVSKSNFNDREELRNLFDNAIQQKGMEPRFLLEEYDYELIDYEEYL